MNESRLEQIVNAVLYEGYILYPYRPSSKKNRRERFTFGRVYPETYSVAQAGLEPCLMQTQCLVVAAAGVEPPAIEVSVRFLHPMAREIGVPLEVSTESSRSKPKLRIVPELRVDDQLFQTWHEAVERRVDLPQVKLNAPDGSGFRMPFAFPSTRIAEPITDRRDNMAGVLIRRQETIEGVVEIAAQPLGPGVLKITAQIFNRTAMTGAELADPEAVLLRTLASTHTILEVHGGEFVSLVDPATEYRSAADQCENIGAWPVLVGDAEKRERNQMLSSPIILYDYPVIAPESAGPMFDGTEIDEILTLRILTLTDAEKSEMRAADEHARRLLERTESLDTQTRLNLHGTMRNAAPGGPVEFDDFFGASTRLEGVSVGGIFLRPGDRVRLRPRGRADVIDLALDGQIAIVEAVEQDIERRVHLAVVLENDPGRDLGLMRQPGHRFFYGVDEVEPLREELA
jgi:hydrogenase maturation protease